MIFSKQARPSLPAQLLLLVLHHEKDSATTPKRTSKKRKVRQHSIFICSKSVLIDAVSYIMLSVIGYTYHGACCLRFMLLKTWSTLHADVPSLGYELEVLLLYKASKYSTVCTVCTVVYTSNQEYITEGCTTIFTYVGFLPEICRQPRPAKSPCSSPSV